MSTNKIQAWHFVGNRLRDGRKVPEDGVTLRHDGDIVLRKSGLYASTRIMDALKYASGATACRVECGGTIVHGDDSIAASEWTILWRVDATDVLLKFARQCAIDVAHLWDMPDIVREYLETGDETKQAEAKEAAGVAAREARAATMAFDAAEAATWAATWGAEAATWGAEAAAAGAAEAATWAATWAVEAAAWGAVEATRRAFKERQAARLKAMVEECRTTGRV